MTRYFTNITLQNTRIRRYERKSNKDKQYKKTKINNKQKRYDKENYIREELKRRDIEMMGRDDNDGKV